MSDGREREAMGRGEEKENQNGEVKVKEVFKRGGRENGKWKQEEEKDEKVKEELILTPLSIMDKWQGEESLSNERRKQVNKNPKEKWRKEKKRGGDGGDSEKTEWEEEMEICASSWRRQRNFIVFLFQL